MFTTFNLVVLMAVSIYRLVRGFAIAGNIVIKIYGNYTTNYQSIVNMGGVVLTPPSRIFKNNFLL